MNKLITSLLLIVFALKFISCSSKPTEGNKEETPKKSIVSGYIYKDDHTPAVGVKVRFVPVNFDPHAAAKALAASDSAITDTTGQYGINTLQPGTYNLLASNTNSSQLAYTDSVLITGDTNNLDADTLKTPGGLHGFIKMQPGDLPTTAVVFAFGTYTFSPVESNAAFALTNLAEGQYRVRILSILDKYRPLDTILSVKAGKDSLLPDSIELPLAIPIPNNFTLDYDTFTQIVTLAWNKADTAIVKGYNIYRQRIDSVTAEDKLNVSPNTDTIFKDSAALQDKIYVYRISSVNLAEIEGVKTKRDTVIIRSIFEPLDTLGGGGSGNGKFMEIGDIVVLSNGAIMALDRAGNKVQRFDSAGDFLSAWGQTGASDSDLVNPTAITADDSGFLYVVNMLGDGRVQKFDTTGKFIKSWLVGQYGSGICYAAGNLYLACLGRTIDTPSLKVINLLTDTISQFLTQGTNPFGIGYYQSQLYVTADNKMLVFDTIGTALRQWGEYGARNGQLSLGGHIAISSAGKIYVTDQENGRIQVFDTDGNFIAKLILAPLPEGSSQVNITKRPRGVALDNHGTLYVADQYYIYKYKTPLQ
jgi:DNA-binding beta-propeller fold protein YncE